MENQKNIIDFIKKMYLIYNKSNYESLIDFCYSYKINTSDYNKDISNISKEITSTIINTLKNKKINYTTKEYKKSIRTNIIFSSENYPTSEAKIIIPVTINTISQTMAKILVYIINNNINCKIKISKINNNELLSIKFLNYKDINNFMEFYYNSEEINKELMIEIIDIIPTKYGLGICTDIYPYNYINFFVTILCKYFKNIKEIEDIEIDQLLEFIQNIEKKEKRILKKEMLQIITRCINVIEKRENPTKIFDYNEEMNIGSFDPSNFNLLLDDNKLVYFESKDKSSVIVFGMDEYLNICYSKFYKNVIEKNPNNLYYSFYKNIYRKLLENNYDKMFELLDFSSMNQDIIYQELMLIASGYFAYKKLNFSYNSINIILKKVLEKKLNCKIKYDSFEPEQYVEKKFVFPFSIEYGNKVIYLKDNKVTTVYNYFKENDVLEYIPINSIVNMKDGTEIKAQDYLKNIYLDIPNYNNFKELLDKQINFVEYIN